MSAPAPDGTTPPPLAAEVLHFSEDPTITRFEPHRAATARDPRALAWTVTTTAEDAARTLGPGGGERVHAVEHRWLRRIADPHAVVSEEAVSPHGPAEPVGDLLALHERAGIQLRVLPELAPFWRAVVGSTLGFSGIRLGEAASGARR